MEFDVQYLCDGSVVGITAFSQGREYNSLTHPFIFIGGHPRSGTTLLRAMLDSHPLVRQDR